MNLNWSEFQIINSSAILDICIEHIDELYKKSKTKSLSETVSKELFVGSSNFSFLVVYHLSILKDVPEKAPAPKGFWFKLFILEENLNLSLLNISTFDKK